MIGKQELRRAFGNKPFVTKGDVKDALGYKKYDDVRPFFIGLESIGRRYLTEDVIERMMELKRYG